ncbi:MAG: HD domain-containing protein [Ignavibacteriaceae bacterium]
MLNQKELIALKKGDIVKHFLLVKKCDIRTAKSNKQYLSLELADKTFTLSSNVWDNFNSFFEEIKTGVVVFVTGFIEDYQGSPQIRITSIRFAETADRIEPSDFMEKSKRDLEEMKNEFFNRLESISDNKLKALLKLVFDEDNFKKFSFAPAGKAWHHSYIHGLLEHTLEIIKICDLMCDIHPELNRDLLISGAMMHDFGKTEELSFDSAYEYTDKGKLIGHIVISAMKINEEAKKIPGFPEDLKNCLIHLILSHQGKLEYASPVVPKTIEAIVLYHADELSAKTNAYKRAIQAGTLSDNKWTKFISLASTDLFNHGIFSQTEEEINKTLFD